MNVAYNYNEIDHISLNMHMTWLNIAKTTLSLKYTFIVVHKMCKCQLHCNFVKS